MATFVETSQWVSVNKLANTDFVVAEGTIATLSAASPFMVGEYVTGANGAAGYVYVSSGSKIEIACITSTVFAAGAVSSSGASATISSVSVSSVNVNKSLMNLVDRTKYLKTTLDAFTATASPAITNMKVNDKGSYKVTSTHVLNGTVGVWNDITTFAVSPSSTHSGRGLFTLTSTWGNTYVSAYKFRILASYDLYGDYERAVGGWEVVYGDGATYRMNMNLSGHFTCIAGVAMNLKFQYYRQSGTVSNDIDNSAGVDIAPITFTYWD